MTKKVFLLGFLMLTIVFLTNTKLYAQEWTQKDNMPFARTQAMAFSIGSKGYFVGGVNDDISNSNELWEWDATTEIWTQKADLTNNIVSGVAFSIGNKGYITAGYGSEFYTDLLEWNQATDTWSAKSSLPVARAQASVFIIGTKVYLVGGFDENYNSLNEMWEWEQTTDTWTQKTDLPEAIFGVAAFAIGTKGYFIGGVSGTSPTNKLWEWTQETNSWEQKENIPVARVGAVSLSIEDRRFIATGESTSSYLKDLWEWDVSTENWIQRTDLPASYRARSCAFTIDNKGYILGGAKGSDVVDVLNEMWELQIEATEINDIRKSTNNIKIFPNPSSNNFNIQFNKDYENIDIKIIDLAGRNVYSEKTNISNNNDMVNINIENLPKGIYMINIKTEKEYFLEKLIIQ